MKSQTSELLLVRAGYAAEFVKAWDFGDPAARAAHAKKFLSENSLKIEETTIIEEGDDAPQVALKSDQGQISVNLDPKHLGAIALTSDGTPEDDRRRFSKARIVFNSMLKDETLPRSFKAVIGNVSGIYLPEGIEDAARSKELMMALLGRMTPLADRKDELGEFTLITKYSAPWGFKEVEYTLVRNANTKTLGMRLNIDCYFVGKDGKAKIEAVEALELFPKFDLAKELESEQARLDELSS